MPEFLRRIGCGVVSTNVVSPIVEGIVRREFVFLDFILCRSFFFDDGSFDRFTMTRQHDVHTFTVEEVRPPDVPFVFIEAFVDVSGAKLLIDQVGSFES